MIEGSAAEDGLLRMRRVSAGVLECGEQRVEVVGMFAAVVIVQQHVVG